MRLDGREPIAGSPEAIETLRSAGLRVAFATNNSRSSTEDYVAHCGAWACRPRWPTS